MILEPQVSDLRIEKSRAYATIALSTGETVSGCFFVARISARVPGPERVAEILNNETIFFPFEIEEPGGPRTALLNRGQVVSIALADHEARRDPGYDVARRRDVSVRLSDGRKLHGSVRVYLPEGKDRLSDWARHPGQFCYLEAGETTLILNVAHIIEVNESPASRERTLENA